MMYTLVCTEEMGSTATFPIESINIIPADVDLLITMPELTTEADFYVAVETLNMAFETPTRRIFVIRSGDVSIQGIAR